MAEEPRRFNDVFQSLPTTIFEEMSLLAAKHGSTNLGQGFPDNELEGPEGMKQAVARCVGVCAAADTAGRAGCC